MQLSRKTVSDSTVSHDLSLPTCCDITENRCMGNRVWKHPNRGDLSRHVYKHSIEGRDGWTEPHMSSVNAIPLFLDPSESAGAVHQQRRRGLLQEP